MAMNRHSQQRLSGNTVLLTDDQIDPELNGPPTLGGGGNFPLTNPHQS